MWTDALGNPVTLEAGDSSLAALNDFVEGFIASEARAINVEGITRGHYADSLAVSVAIRNRK